MNLKEVAWDLGTKIYSYARPGDYLKIVVALIYEECHSRHYFGHYDESLVKNTLNESKKVNYDDARMILSVLALEEMRELIKIIAKEESLKHFEDVTSTKELRELVIKLLKIESGDMVADICCGAGMFLVDVTEYAENNNFELKDYSACDININSIETAKMLLPIFGNLQASFESKDLLTEKAMKMPYNKAFCFPPFNYRGYDIQDNNRYKIKNMSHGASDWLFVDRVLNGLDYRDHRAIVLLPAGDLFRINTQDYRDALLKDGKIEGIISLPSGAIPNLMVNTCLVILSSNNTEVKMVDATGVVDTKGRSYKNVVLPVSKIYDMYQHAKSISFEKMMGKSFIPAIYLEETEDIKLATNNFKTLGELGEVSTGCQYTSRNFEDSFTEEETGYQILTSSDIENSVVDWKSLQRVKLDHVKFDKYALQKNDLVITSKSSKIKIVVVDEEAKEKILVTGGMLIVRPNVDLVNPTYLKMYLDSEIGRKALASIQKGSTIVTINASGLATIKIPMVEMKKQCEMANNYNDLLNEINNLKKNVESKENKLSNYFVNELKEKSN